MSGTHRICNQHPRIIKKPSKKLSIYKTKQEYTDKIQINIKYLFENNFPSISHNGE